ncbi:MAG: M23 family metallopeptidase [Jiangellaceae bacterium]
MPSPTTCARVACALALAAATTPIVSSSSFAAAVDPTTLSAATDAATAATAALADATASAEKAEKAVTETGDAVRIARSALLAARSRSTRLSERVAVAAAEREQRVRQQRAAAVREHRAAAMTVTEAEGLLDAAEAAYLAAEEQQKGASAESATATEAAEKVTASLGIDRRWVMPGLGAISSPYGIRRHPVTGAHKVHTGIDFRPADGSAYAAAGGTVAAVTVDPAYGNLVTIAHGNGITTRYAHLARALVNQGDRVAGGEVIGRIGSTGLSTGPHLHFEVQVDGEFRDPGPWLAR